MQIESVARRCHHCVETRPAWGVLALVPLCRTHYARAQAEAKLREAAGRVSAEWAR
jgi:hypothetical protein